MEVVGYSFRLASHYRPFVVVYFVVQYFMVRFFARFSFSEYYALTVGAQIVVSPVFFSAAIYLSLTRAAKAHGTETHLPFSARAIVSSSSHPLLISHISALIREAQPS